MGGQEGLRQWVCYMRDEKLCYIYTQSVLCDLYVERMCDMNMYMEGMNSRSTFRDKVEQHGFVGRHLL